MSEFFQVRKNTRLFPKGRNQIVMVLFLIWLLQWANLFMCRLSLFLQTFQPPLSKAHPGGRGPGSWSFCRRISVGEAQRRWCLLVSYQSNTIWGHTHVLRRSHLPCTIHPTLHQGCRSRFSTAPWLSSRGQSCMFPVLPGTGRQPWLHSKCFETCPCRRVAAWDRSDSWESVDSKMPGGFGQFTAAVTHQSPWKCNAWCS